MMIGNLTGLHLLIILGIVILLFGATKLPALAKGLGQSINIFKKEMSDDEKKAQANGTAPDGTVQNSTVQSVPTEPAAGPVLNPGSTAQPNTDSRR
jgi:sec-independent protein translocase protein TatA